ncbi:uncharacterized protein AB675_8360 [Cyphellophora attinorum]|uniref:Transcription factor domain-containing protein n=1 Tax=Cyphellophora attinorum TaxID=1664694 RepID=A0A0N1HA08_9EURO|nr:uncharacterized protein AB675_8360 [Phialophora attinorum]KPI44570.1 hypothetical protein AB675_8360 [Phialophora attinorum]
MDRSLFVVAAQTPVQSTPPRERSSVREESRQQQRYTQSFDPNSFFFAPSQAVGPDAESFVLDGELAAAQPYTYDELFSTSFTAVEVPGMYDAGVGAAGFHTPLPPVMDPMSSPGGSTGSSVASVQRDLSMSRAPNSKTESTDLIETFYKYFYPAHPFIIPQKLAKQRPELLPEPLRATMRFIAAHYVPNHNIHTLQKAAQVIFSDRVPDDIFKLQGLMLYIMLPSPDMSKLLARLHSNKPFD